MNMGRGHRPAPRRFPGTAGQKVSAAGFWEKGNKHTEEDENMAVFRAERTENYTIMSNYHLRDKSISLKAKELLSQMLSLPEDWDYTLTGLAKINQEGKDAIRAAVTELERAGYIRCRQTVDRAGKFSNNEYIIQERPVSALVPPAGPPSAIPS